MADFELFATRETTDRFAGARGDNTKALTVCLVTLSLADFIDPELTSEGAGQFMAGNIGVLTLAAVLREKCSSRLFQTTHGRPGFLNQNNYRNRVLKPAAIRAGVGVIDTGKLDKSGKPVLKEHADPNAARRPQHDFADLPKEHPERREVGFG